MLVIGVIQGVHVAWWSQAHVRTEGGTPPKASKNGARPIWRRVDVTAAVTRQVQTGHHLYRVAPFVHDRPGAAFRGPRVCLKTPRETTLQSARGDSAGKALQFDFVVAKTKMTHHHFCFFRALDRATAFPASHPVASRRTAISCPSFD